MFQKVKNFFIAVFSTIKKAFQVNKWLRLVGVTIASVVLVTAILLPFLFPVALTEPYKDFIFTLSEDGTYYSVMLRADCKDEDVVIPSKYKNKPVSKIDSYAFTQSPRVKNVKISDSVKWIDYYAFFNCANLKSVTIGKSVESIHELAFEKSSTLAAIKVTKGNKTYTSINGNLYTKDKKTLLKYAPGKTDSFSVPNHVQTIGNYAFNNSHTLEALNLPDSVQTIGIHAFSNNDALRSVSIANGLQSVGVYTFSDCNALQNVVLPNTLQDVSKGMFLNCTSLRTVTIPESVKTVDESAFSGCEALESITFPKQVNFIGKEAFLDCDALKNVTFENKEGWYVRPSKSSLSHVFDVTPEDLNNQETVQEYLIHRYNDYYWYRREII